HAAKVAGFRDLGQLSLDTAAAGNHSSLESLTAAQLADGQTIAEKVIGLTGKIGEKLEIVGYENIEADQVVPYIRSNGKLGVLVAFEGTEGADLSEVGKDIAMQIAAMRPVAQIGRAHV